jgi:hypothetical protein
MAKRLFCCVLAGAVAAGCATPQVIPLQMSAEYGCPASSVKVTNVYESTYRGEGCGHTDTFVCTAPSGVGNDPTMQCFKVTQPDAGAK